MLGDPKKHTAVLNRIAIFSFGFMCVATWTLFQFSEVDPEPTIDVPFLDLSLPAVWVAGIVIASIVFRTIRLHARISDLLRICERYDIYEIILPLFRGSSPGRPAPDLATLKEKRKKLVRYVYYCYIPGPAGSNRIPDHLVNLARDSLCWLWIVLEAATIALIFAGIAIWLDGHPATIIFWAAFLATLILYFPANLYCRRQTGAEVEALLEDPKLREQIRRSFDEILG